MATPPSHALPPISPPPHEISSVLFAHAPQSRACDLLMQRLAAVLGARPSFTMDEVESLEAAWVAMDRAAVDPETAGRLLVIASLDLPPVPRGAMTICRWARSLEMPIVLVAHGRRWLPPGLDVPSLSPSASREEVEQLLESLEGEGPSTGVRPTVREPGVSPPGETTLLLGDELPPESFPGRPSWF